MKYLSSVVFDQDIVFAILQFFADLGENKSCVDYIYLDVKIERDEEFCSITVTNCGQSFVSPQNLLNNCFDEFYQDSPLACYIKMGSLFTVNESDGKHEVWKLRFTGNEFKIRRKIIEGQFQHLAHLKKFMSLSLKSLLSWNSSEASIKNTIKNLTWLSDRKPNVKFIFRSGDLILWCNHERIVQSIDNCGIVATAICPILEQTKNRGFRDNSMYLLGIWNPTYAKNVITEKLVSFIRKKYFCERRNRKINNNR